MPFLLSLGEGVSRWGLGSVDEVDGSGAQVGLRVAATGGGLDAVPDDLGEPAGDGAGAAVLLVGGHVEPDPRDHVILRARAGADELVVDGEEEGRVVPPVERALDLRRVPLRAG